MMTRRLDVVRLVLPQDLDELEKLGLRKLFDFFFFGQIFERHVADLPNSDHLGVDHAQQQEVPLVLLASFELVDVEKQDKGSPFSAPENRPIKIALGILQTT